MEAMIPVGADLIWAQDSGGPGPVAVLAHEGVADARSWDLIWPALTERARVIRYDMRGYGRSPRPTERYRQAGDLAAVLDHFGVSAAHLAGCSAGGATCVELALADPGRVRSLVLLAPGIEGYDWPAEPELDAEYEALEAAGDEDGLVALVMRVWGAAGPAPGLRDMVLSAVRAWPAESELEDKGAECFSRLPELGMPVTMLVGDLDREALIACAKAMSARIGDCHFTMIPGADHYPMLREPDLVAKAILAACGVA